MMYKFKITQSNNEKQICYVDDNRLDEFKEFLDKHNFHYSFNETTLEREIEILESETNLSPSEIVGELYDRFFEVF